ncbi:MAG TPA: ATP-binding protein, partial [Alphaproteobacteria bacterium]|nr:ATP-binding protein [Alphaproteobacteria bacterium]
MPVFPDHILTILKAQKSLAVALSGGPDSMALAHALHALGFKLHLLTVDHGLRDESADEAKSVGAWVRGWKGCTHHILRWQGQKAASRIQENARAARYGLMAEYCRMHGIAHLCLAHHRD